MLSSSLCGLLVLSAWHVWDFFGGPVKTRETEEGADGIPMGTDWIVYMSSFTSKCIPCFNIHVHVSIEKKPIAVSFKWYNYKLLRFVEQIKQIWYRLWKLKLYFYKRLFVASLYGI